jgi:hypothetical protein
MNNNTKETIKISLLILLWLMIFMTFTIIIASIFNYMICKGKYTNSDFKIFGWCLVEYNWKYIPETLYEKSFIQNLNINLNKYE